MDAPGSAGSTASAGLAGLSGTHPRTGQGAGPGSVLDEVRAWLARYIRTVHPCDLDLLGLWAAHTHLVAETYTTPRLVLDSPVPEAGKTTVLQHLERLCVDPIQMASVSSPALLARVLETGIRTILIDEADRSLDPKREGTADLIAILNSGYKRGGKRPVLVPAKGGSWSVAEMSTFGPVVMAGNNPDLPDDTRTRSIRVLLIPDIDGLVEESDWELIESDADAVAGRLAAWADEVREEVRTARPALPAGVVGRARERWAPLLRVAVAAGGRWPAVVLDLAARDVERIKTEKEDGVVSKRPHVIMVEHMAAVWPAGVEFVATDDLLARLIDGYPGMWGATSSYGKALTAQRLGRMLVQHYDIRSYRPPSGDRIRGYRLIDLQPAFTGFGLRPSGPEYPSGRTGQTGRTGEPAGVTGYWRVSGDPIAGPS